MYTIDAFSTPRNRITTLILLAICALSAIGAAVAGIDDNPPGILLAFLSAIAFVLAFVHPWRTVRQFMVLLIASLIGLVLFVILNNLFAAVAHNPATPGALQILMQGLAVVAFILGTLICPAAFCVGCAGAIWVAIRNRTRSTGHSG